MGTTDDRSSTTGVEGPSADELAKAAEDFLRGLLREFGAQAEIASDRPTEEVLAVLISGDHLGTLIGPKGATLAALQELTRIVLQHHLPRSELRVIVDVNGYRKRRAEALARFARQVATDVLASNKKRALEPMLPADRKVVHDAVSAISGVTTVSEGEEPNRRVVLVPVAEAASEAASSDNTLESARS
jgi:spoIIIJ-associated protein